jgi:CDP-glucose 4,6-dehydratase
VLEVVALVCEVAQTGVQPDIRGRGTPAGEITRQWVDSRKLRALAGWKPQVSLNEGLQRTVEWYREHIHGHGG